jgi:GDP-L-fucose synthase
MSKKINIFVAGHKGMVGSNLVKQLEKIEKNNLILVDKREVNLLNQKAVEKFFKSQKIDQVYLTAAKVGGILANQNFPANFIYENLIIQCNVIQSSFKYGVKKLLFFGSSCIYPKNISRPIKEKDLLSNYLEQTNEPYGIAKISGIKLCESYNRQYSNNYGIDYRSIMPTNVYGPGDNYDPNLSHVIPGMIYRIYDAKIKKKKEVVIWGSGRPRREFVYVEDLAKSAIAIMNIPRNTYYKYVPQMNSHINIGTGSDVTINFLARLIKKIVGYKGKLRFDTRKPDGVKRKLLDIKLSEKLGIKNPTPLKIGLYKTYKNFINSK